MKYLNGFILFCLLTGINSVCYSQKVTLGYYCGVNFSDIHGQDIYGKWSVKPGPVQGINLGYSFNNIIGIRTGITYSAVYYEYNTEKSPLVFYDSQPILTWPVYYPTSPNMDFSFLRIPLQLTISIPAAIRLDLGAGTFFSRVIDKHTGFYAVNLDKNDFGYIYSSALSYPINDKFRASLNISYLTGRKEFIENSNYRHGSSEFTFGVMYTGFNNKRKSEGVNVQESDSAAYKVRVTIKGGINLSWNNDTDFGKYKPYLGPSVGFLLRFPLRNRISLLTGFSLDRKGYALKDSSISFFRYLRDDNTLYYVDSKVEIDYAVLPALISIPVTKSDKLFFVTGTWLGLRLNARNIGNGYHTTRDGTSYLLRKTVIYDDLEQLLNRNDFGWLAGCNISLPVMKGNSRLDMSLQYTMGLRDVYNHSYFRSRIPLSDENIRIKNGTISFLIGITLPSDKHLK